VEWPRPDHLEFPGAWARLPLAKGRARQGKPLSDVGNVSDLGQLAVRTGDASGTRAYSGPGVA
jgi:hypothetical protein